THGGSRFASAIFSSPEGGPLARPVQLNTHLLSWHGLKSCLDAPVARPNSAHPWCLTILLIERLSFAADVSRIIADEEHWPVSRSWRGRSAETLAVAWALRRTVPTGRA